MAESERIEVTRHRRPQDNPCTLAHRGRPESISLIVSSYNQPRSLALVLDALTRQSWRADEIIIADDGSRPPTFAAIERFAAHPALPPIHALSQADEGFRKTVALNGAILASRGQQLLFLDGDVIPSPDWIERHRASYRPMGYAVGDYVRLDRRDSLDLYALRADGERLDDRRAALVAAQRRYLFKRAARARFHMLCRKTMRPRLLGGNFSVDRGLLFGVNGFEERFVGCGGEDSNLRNRLNRYGGRPSSLIRTAVGLHLSPGLDDPQPARNRISYLDSPLRHEAPTRRARMGLAERLSGGRGMPEQPAPEAAPGVRGRLPDPA